MSPSFNKTDMYASHQNISKGELSIKNTMDQMDYFKPERKTKLTPKSNQGSQSNRKLNLKMKDILRNPNKAKIENLYYASKKFEENTSRN